MQKKNKTTEQIIARNAIVNIFGMIGKGLLPVYFVINTRLYGPEIMGVFLIIYTMIEICTNLTVSGLNDGVLMFASRHSDEPEKIYQFLANGLLMSLGISALVIVFAHWGGPKLLLSSYSQKGLLIAIQNIVWSIPFVAIPLLVIAITKSRLTMKWDALLLGFFRPFFLTVFSIIFYVNEKNLNGLVKAYICTACLLTFFATIIFSRYYSFKKLYSHIIHFKLHKNLIKFAIPQSLNMTFNTFVTNLDIMMLGYFSIEPKLIAFYGIGAQIVRNVRQIRLVFSNSYAPVIARLYGKGQLEELNISFSRVTRWISVMALPASLMILIFKDDLIKIFSPQFTGNTDFMLVLLIAGILNCLLGLSGNVVGMTGHTTWNLINSIIVSGINFILNWILITKYGLMGAAVATCIATIIIIIAQLIEIKYLVNVRIRLNIVYKPFVAIIPSVLVLIFFKALLSTFMYRIVAATISIALYLTILKLLKFKSKSAEAQE